MKHEQNKEVWIVGVYGVLNLSCTFMVSYDRNHALFYTAKLLWWRYIVWKASKKFSFHCTRNWKLHLKCLFDLISFLIIPYILILMYINVVFLMNHINNNLCIENSHCMFSVVNTRIVLYVVSTMRNMLKYIIFRNEIIVKW